MAGIRKTLSAAAADDDDNDDDDIKFIFLYHIIILGMYHIVQAIPGVAHTRPDTEVCKQLSYCCLSLSKS